MFKPQVSDSQKKGVKEGDRVSVESDSKGVIKTLEVSK